MKLYKITKFVETYYKSNIKNNATDRHELIRKKLTRNILLSEELFPISKNTKVYQYGNLIIITRRNKVIWIHNLVGKVPFEVDKIRKRRLNRELGIE